MVDENLKQSYIARNREEYGEKYGKINWISHDRALHAAEERTTLLGRLRQRASFGNKGSKVDISRLSPGCRICGDGTWSCLFINAQCNCRCFYCPSPQNEMDLPTTNSLIFEDPYQYAEYIDRFDFRGVSISGGEPLLSLNRTLKFLRVLRKRFDDSLHLWLYTNGTQVDAGVLHKLRDAGLDEIRFDIGAVHYNLERVKMAVGIIPIVTVEIPAVPEDEALLKRKLTEMKECSVDYLNLHQLRLTPHNFGKLAERDYTFLHGQKVTVLESELTALRLALYSLENGIGLPVNYCSFVYKNRYQKSATRRRNASHYGIEEQHITEKGLIREWNAGAGTVRYSEAKILPSVTYRHAFLKVILDTDYTLYIEKQPVSGDLKIPDDAYRGAGEAAGSHGLIFDSRHMHHPALRPFEIIEEGLQEYF